MKTALFLSAALCAVPLAADAQTHVRELGKETSISSAGHGGIRDWEQDATNRDVVYLQDRMMRWYKVTMSGPCLDATAGSPTLVYQTGPDGRLDRFSTIAAARTPELQCGINSIVTSDAPPSRQPKPKKP